IGKSVSAALAPSTQLRRAGSWVAFSSMGMVARLVVSLELLVVATHRTEQVAPFFCGELGAPLAVERKHVGNDPFGIAPPAVLSHVDVASPFIEAHPGLVARTRLIADIF